MIATDGEYKKCSLRANDVQCPLGKLDNFSYMKKTIPYCLFVCFFRHILHSFTQLYYLRKHSIESFHYPYFAFSFFFWLCMEWSQCFYPHRLLRGKECKVSSKLVIPLLLLVWFFFFWSIYMERKFSGYKTILYEFQI